MKKNLFENLKVYGEGNAYPFHMPGHKRSPESGPLTSFYQYDITEIDDFDNLHQPQGIIKEAQERAAKLYHSQETYFLVNGSTAGILSAVSAIAQEGKKLIVARNCHKAVYHAAFLNLLEIEYLYPNTLTDYHLADGFSASQIQEKLSEISEKEGIADADLAKVVAGIVITSPTYDGILSDVKGIVELAHEYKIPVIIDQAHGAHFGFHSAFPQHAIAEGADIVIHSVHKTLPAPTQTALLHRNGTLIDRDLLRKYLSIYQTSSPSYLLMAGIDSCIELLEKEGYGRFEKLIKMRSSFVKQTKELKHIHVYPSMQETGLDSESIWESGKEEPGRLVISVDNQAMTGQQLYDKLRLEYELQMEMCGADYVVAILSIMDSEEGFERLANALIEIDAAIEPDKNVIRDLGIGKIANELRPQKMMRLDEAYKRENEKVWISKAEGKIAAEFVNLYPPGIPLLVPGEIIDKKMILLIKQYLQNGYVLQGIDKNTDIDRSSVKIVR